MKKILLTSSIGTYQKIENKKIPIPIDNSNHIVDIIKESLSIQSQIVLIPSDPKDFQSNDENLHVIKQSFLMSNLPFQQITVMDDRNKLYMEDIQKADIIILGGGHLPTQNKWFKEIQLKEKLQNYKGLIIGQSAGSMNCAQTVYSCPELEEEVSDPNFKRWIDGLSLTNINIFPHYQLFKTLEIVGKNLINDFVMKDSFICPIYALNDGSFIEINKDQNIIYGECFKIWNGQIIKINDNQNKAPLT